MEEGRDEGSHDAGGRQSGRDEHAFSLPALPEPGRYSAWAAAAHPAGDCRPDGRRSFSPEEGCERYLDYALSHPHEYELLFQQEYELFHSARSMRAGVKLAAADQANYETKADGKVRQIARQSRAPPDSLVDAGPRSSDAADRKDDPAKRCGGRARGVHGVGGDRVAGGSCVKDQQGTNFPVCQLRAQAEDGQTRRGPHSETGGGRPVSAKRRSHTVQEKGSVLTLAGGPHLRRVSITRVAKALAEKKKGVPLD